MLKAMYLKLAESGGPKAYGFGPGVHTSVYPLKKGGVLEPNAKHSQKWDDCVSDVKKKGEYADPYAVCTSSLGSDSFEADSGSAFPSQLRSKNKEKAAPKFGNLKSKVHLREAVKDALSGTKFKVVLIKEGLGNLKDCFYYTKESLQQAPPLFEGKKAFVDHPSSLEEQTRPERSTRDICGYYENVQYVEVEGRGQLEADLCLVKDPSLSWTSELLSTAIDFAQKFPEGDFVGLSINASGEANEVPISDFLKESTFPPSVLSKLQQAQAEGINLIRVVSSLKEAVSCDLVTEAGAGGKILQMIEQEKPMKQKQKHEGMEKHEGKEKHEGHEKHEAKQKHEAEKEGEAHEAAADGDDGQGDGAKPEHDDEDQDKALFAKMIKQYLGDEHADDQEAHEMAKEAYQACQSEGMEHDEAYEAAGKHLKMALAIGKKMAQKQKHEAHEDHEAHEASEKHEAEKHECKQCQADAAAAADGDDGDDDDKAAKKQMPPGKAKESSQHRNVLRLSAENARLKESLKRYELKEYLDKKLMESKKPVQVTKKFREALGAPKSREHIDSAYRLFMAAYQSAEAEGSDSFGAFFTEKTSFKESNGAAGSFDDCLN